MNPEKLPDSFKPVTIEGGYENLQSKVDIPAAAIRDGIETKVILDIFVDSLSTVANINVVRYSRPSVINAIVDAIKETNFHAATLDGKSVNSIKRIPIGLHSKVVGETTPIPAETRFE